MELLFILIFLLSILGAFLFSGVEAAMLAVNRKFLAFELRDESKPEHDVFRLVSDARHKLAVTLIGLTLCVCLGGGTLFLALRWLLDDWRAAREVYDGFWLDGVALALTVPLATTAYFLSAEILARPLIRRRADAYLVTFGGLLQWAGWVTAPCLRLFTRAADWVIRPFGLRAVPERPMSMGEIMEILSDTAEDDSHFWTERDMIEGAIDLEQSSVREVMRPLVDVVAVRETGATIAAVLDLARVYGYSRFPVYRGRVIDMTAYVDVPAILKDGREDGPLAPFIRPALIVPETMRIDVLLRQMTNRRKRCAIVVDEYGGSVGWVTREDVLEEIVGDIADKDADGEPGWTRDEDGRFLVDARMDLDDLNEAIGAQLAKGDNYDTLGGWLYRHIGYVPDVGETVEEDGVKVVVKTMDGHRIVTAELELEQPTDNR